LITAEADGPACVATENGRVLQKIADELLTLVFLALLAIQFEGATARPKELARVRTGNSIADGVHRPVFGLTQRPEAAETAVVEQSRRRRHGKVRESQVHEV